MWSTLTNALTKDLGEFAAVVGTDTKRLLGEDMNSDDILGGDEETELGKVAKIEGDVLLKFQKDEKTYLDALTDAQVRIVDDELANRYEGPAELIDPLMEKSVIVPVLYEQLVTETEQVSSKVFFERYFLKLQLLRLDVWKAAEALKHKSASATTTNNKHLANPHELEDWDDIDGGQETAQKKDDKEHNDDEAAVLRLALKKQKERVTELEKLVTALHAQVESLRADNDDLSDENKQLKAQMATQQSSGDTPRTKPDELAASPPKTPQSETPVRETKKEATPLAAAEPPTAPQDDSDDDWGSLT